MNASNSDRDRIRTSSDDESTPATMPSGAHHANPRALAGEERRVFEEMEIGRDTSDLIIGITQAFNSEQSYDAAMRSVLEMISRVLHPERLIVFERGEETTSCTFEWCAEGIPSQIERLRGIPNSQFDTMGKLANSDNESEKPKVLVSDVDKLKGVDGKLYRQFDRQGVARMMAAPLFHDGKIIGYLSANNFALEEGLDAKRVLDTVASFISARIVNQRLVTELAHTGTHDRLTGLLNRWGIDASISERLSANPHDPYALILIDVDDFKAVNDLHGHDVGDAALKSLAKSIGQAFPASAIIGRNGGDEFLVMLSGDDAEKADRLLEEYSKLELGCDVNGKHYPLSTSVGYAAYPSQAKSLEDAYTKADAALYTVKLAGKSGIARYSSKLDLQYRSQLGFTARDLIEHIPGAIMVYRDAEGSQLLFANESVVTMFECDDYADFASLTDGSFANMVHPADKSRILEGTRRRTMPKGTSKQGVVEYRIVTKSGAVKAVVEISRLTEIAEVGAVYYTLMISGD